MSSPTLCTIPVYILYSQYNTGNLPQGTIGASALHRQWIGLSVSGDEVTVEPLPFQPSYLQSLDVEVGFMRRNLEVAEQFSADEMAKNFIRAFQGQVFSAGQIMAFEFHGQNLRGTIKALSVVELPESQSRGGPPPEASFMGVLMEKSDVTILKSPDSTIKIKSSAKKYVLIVWKTIVVLIN